MAIKSKMTEKPKFKVAKKDIIHKDMSAIITKHKIYTDKEFNIKDIHRIFIAEHQICIATTKEQAQTFHLQFGDSPDKLPKSEQVYPNYANIKKVAEMLEALERIGFKQIRSEKPKWTDNIYELAPESDLKR